MAGNGIPWPLNKGLPVIVHSWRLPLPKMAGQTPNPSTPNLGADGDGGDGGGGEEQITDYERQRLSRIRSNMARMAALGLPTLSSSLSTSSKGEGKPASNNKKTKKKAIVEDDEYTPNREEDDDASSSSSEDGEEDEQLPRRRKVRDTKFVH